ncbi:hypothetical protein QLX08_007062 [Tetragonisca angustula]|uniref:Uncharacterized protein n=1 Tax=Tetragonisca angustula TaxID=166442 RepID=A0AAW0ZRE0_9HYME
MSFFIMQKFHGLILFIWLTSILTLSVSDEIKTDGDTLMLTLNANFTDRNSKTEHRTSSSLIQFMPESVDSTKTRNKNVATPLIAEGGPIPIVSIIESIPTESHKYVTNVTDNLDIRTSVLEDDDVPYVKKKTTSKIISRKGAINDISSSKTILSDDTKSIIKSSTTVNVYNNEKIVNNLKSNVTEKYISDASSITVNNTFHFTNMMPQKLSTNVPIIPSLVQEHKPKPTATIIEPNSDKQAFIPHTKGSHLGMPKKINYVLPVIVTLIALPVLGAIVFMLYKQGRDCWDKRHYRRMDFLIDGMYND